MDIDLTGIIAVSGNSGLFKIVSRSRNGLIVEDIEAKKRIPIYTHQTTSSLEDISIFTTSGDLPLKEVLVKFYEANGAKKGLGHKEDAKKLRTFLSDVVEDCDHSRIYDSDLKKLFKWYNILFDAGMLKLEKKKATAKEVDKTEASTEKKTASQSAKKVTTKKATATKPAGNKKKTATQSKKK